MCVTQASFHVLTRHPHACVIAGMVKKRLSQSFKLLLDLVRRVTYKEVIASRLNIAGVLETTYGIIHTSALSNINGVLHL